MVELSSFKGPFPFCGCGIVLHEVEMGQSVNGRGGQCAVQGEAEIVLEGGWDEWGE